MLVWSLALAHALPLQDVGGNLLPTGAPCATPGELPIGVPTGAGFPWRQEVAGFLGTVALGDVTHGTALGVADLDQRYGVDPGTTACWASVASQTTWDATFTNDPSQREAVESLFLESRDISWTGDALVRARLDPEAFLRSTMEDQATCQVMAPTFLYDPQVSAWSDLAYDGNDQFADPGLRQAQKLRAAAWLGEAMLAWDLMYWSSGSTWVFPDSGNPWGDEPPVLSWGAVPMPAGLPTGPIGSVSGIDQFGAPRTWQANPAFRGDELLNVAQFAATYAHVQSVLSPAQQAAYEEALYRFASRAARTPFQRFHSNRDHLLLISLQVVASVLSGQQATDVWTWYHVRTEEFYDPANGMFRAWGALHDDSGFDLGYGSLNLMHAARLLTLDPNPPQQLVTGANALFDLGLHQVFPDKTASGGTRWTSPSAFNARTGHGIIGNGRFGAAIYQTMLLGGEQHLPWAWGALKTWGANVDAGGPTIDPVTQVGCETLNLLLRIVDDPANDLLQTNNPTPLAQSVEPLEPVVFTRGARGYEVPSYLGWPFHGPGLIDTWYADVAGQPANEQLPIELVGPHQRSFGEAFHFAHTTDSANAPDTEVTALIHSGPVGWMWANGLPPGYGGGQLAIWYTDRSGVVVRNSRLGRNYPSIPSAQDPLVTDWERLPLHAVSLVAPGAWTSSGRIVEPRAAHLTFTHDAPAKDGFALLEQDDEWPWDERCRGEAGTAMVSDPTSGLSATYVTVCGDIPAQDVYGAGTFPNAALSADIPYQRTFLQRDDELYVQTQLRPQQPEFPDEAYETIPLYYGRDADHAAIGDYKIELFDVSGNPYGWAWGPTGMAMVDDVVKVRIDRFGAVSVIEFPTPQRVGLADPFDGADHEQTVNLLIDLLAPALGGPALEDRNIEYVLRPE
ncbi:MAG: hypothetical protein H6738_21550 [Alphaproteobacteria bacterium]|nr:hypothetical protein [Alphaproteobacteria bacterium]MCB9699382.1 hypothetical protein [Alphaproteobacteria bacterium]